MDIFPDIGAPDWGFSSEPEAKVLVSTFGDGYELRRPDGLNHITENWSPSWTSLDPGVAESTYAWLRTRLKWKAFLWNNPVSGVQYKVVCQSVRVTHDDYGNATLSARFVQDHNPA